MSGARTRDAWIATLAGVTFLALTYPWLYRGGFGESDSAAIAVGIHQAALGGQHMREPLLYLPSGHPLYYLALLPWADPARFDHLVSLMNHLSWLSMGGATGLAYLVCRRFASLGWAIAAVVAIASSPIVFELATYGHPITPALFFFLLGVELLLAAVARGALADARGVALVAFSTLAVAASVCTRADIVFFLPSAAALAYGVAPRRRAVIAAGLTSVTALLIYFLVKRLVPHHGHSGAGAASELMTFLSTFYKPSLLRGGVAAFCLAAGPGLCLSLAAGALGLVRRRSWVPLLIGLCAVLPTFVFFVANPYPSRHFLHSVIGVGFFLALAARSLDPPNRWLVAFLPGVIALNLRLLPLVGWVSRAAGLNAFSGDSRRGDPTKGVFDRHRTNQSYFAWDRARWERILATRPQDAVFVGVWSDLTGLMTFASARGDRIVRRDAPCGPDSTWMDISLGGLTVHFWERYTGAPTDPPRPVHGAVYIMTPYPGGEAARLPRGAQEAGAWIRLHRAL